MERKYRQRGYSDAEAREKKRERADRPTEQQQPRPKQDMLGPRTPRMVGHSDEGALLELRGGSRAGIRSERGMSALPGGDAFVQAVRAFRYGGAV